MKKYVKPELFYENYELTQYIASCGATWNNHGKDECSLTVPNAGTYFNTGTAACVNGVLAGINCYQNSSNEGPFTPFLS